MVILKSPLTASKPFVSLIRMLLNGFKLQSEHCRIMHISQRNFQRNASNIFSLTSICHICITDITIQFPVEKPFDLIKLTIQAFGQLPQHLPLDLSRVEANREQHLNDKP